MSYTILAINPGSTSTRLAVFKDDEKLADTEIKHSKDDLPAALLDQVPVREKSVHEFIAPFMEQGMRFDAVIGRGGLLRPLTGGVYRVNKAMLDDLVSRKYGSHACNLGAVLAENLANEFGCLAYMADPVVTDEMSDRAKMTGLPEVSRRSIFHALSQRMAARAVAKELGIAYEEGKFIVAHMGGGVSIGAHVKGQVVDVINALDGEGPFSPERSGKLSVCSVLEQLKDMDMDTEAFKKKIQTKAGMFAHLGTNDFITARNMARQGDENAILVLEAMVYNIAKDICSLVPAASDEPGGIDAIVLTGGLARSKWLVIRIERLAGEVAPVKMVESEEVRAMGQWALMALNGETEIQEY